MMVLLLCCTVNLEDEFVYEQSALFSVAELLSEGFQ